MVRSSDSEFLMVHEADEVFIISIAARWVDPALGFAVGWNCFYTNAISTPSEISAAVILLSFWDENKNHVAIYTVVNTHFKVSELR
ncbi:hypothetical protein DXG01_007401 [Tephrocybe rancida]|nr:hypothetical protein DXG01_007401 [Tephrocybe rancida]